MMDWTPLFMEFLVGYGTISTYVTSISLNLLVSGVSTSLQQQ